MNKWMFYCPHCGCLYYATHLPSGTVPNIRDGFGRSIQHYECNICGNLDAGFIRCNTGSKGDIAYCETVIGLYQGIRGFSKKADVNVT